MSTSFTSPGLPRLRVGSGRPFAVIPGTFGKTRPAPLRCSGASNSGWRHQTSDFNLRFARRDARADR
jgi:hypothetical protein